MKRFLSILTFPIALAALAAAEPSEQEKKIESNLGFGKLSTPAPAAEPGQTNLSPRVRMRGGSSTAPAAPVLPTVVRQGFRLRGSDFQWRGGELSDDAQPRVSGSVQPSSFSPLAGQPQAPVSVVKITEELASSTELDSASSTALADSEESLEDVLFELNSTAFKNPTAADANLRMVANIMKRHPQSRLIIEGHTCDLGDEHFNLVLSCYRADAVARALVRLDIAPSRLETLGFGERDPTNEVHTTDPPAILESIRTPNRRARLRLAAQ